MMSFCREDDVGGYYCIVCQILKKGIEEGANAGVELLLGGAIPACCLPCLQLREPGLRTSTQRSEGKSIATRCKDPTLDWQR